MRSDGSLDVKVGKTDHELKSILFWRDGQCVEVQTWMGSSSRRSDAELDAKVGKTDQDLEPKVGKTDQDLESIWLSKAGNCAEDRS